MTSKEAFDKISEMDNEGFSVTEIYRALNSKPFTMIRIAKIIAENNSIIEDGVMTIESVINFEFTIR